MSLEILKSVVRNRRIETDVPEDWPDGMEVDIGPRDSDIESMREEDWPTTPAAIAAYFKTWEELEPVEMSPTEEAELQAWRKKNKEYTIANMSKGIEDLFE